MHVALKPFLLRRIKEDVEKDIPPLSEIIIDVELTTIQKAYYRAIYERNKTFLKSNKHNISATLPTLNNMEMQLRKCCNHPWLIKGIEQQHLGDDDISDELRIKKMVEASGKFILLEKFLPKLKKEGHRILLFSQFTGTLSLIEEFLQV